MLKTVAPDLRKNSVYPGNTKARHPTQLYIHNWCQELLPQEQASKMLFTEAAKHTFLLRKKTEQVTEAERELKERERFKKIISHGVESDLLSSCLTDKNCAENSREVAVYE